MSAISRTPTPYSYSSAVAAGDFVFLGLHRGFGPAFAEQMTDTFRHLEQTLHSHGLTLDDLVKVNVWLKDIDDLPGMERHFTDHFPPGGFPARMTATTEFIDADCLLMIDGVAYRGRTATKGRERPGTT
ncbi:RidA family protein [Streptomyces sp. NPDC047000]|uniref:RidA family protein n=1 Tax=Streptomyces sp. NPDC047000 TaxID=3155474 RepID=UPI0033E7970D